METHGEHVFSFTQYGNGISKTAQSMISQLQDIASANEHNSDQTWSSTSAGLVNAVGVSVNSHNTISFKDIDGTVGAEAVGEDEADFAKFTMTGSYNYLTAPTDGMKVLMTLDSNAGLNHISGDEISIKNMSGKGTANNDWNRVDVNKLTIIETSNHLHTKVEESIISTAYATADEFTSELDSATFSWGSSGASGYLYSSTGMTGQISKTVGRLIVDVSDSANGGLSIHSLANEEVHLIYDAGISDTTQTLTVNKLDTVGNEVFHFRNTNHLKVESITVPVDKSVTFNVYNNKATDLEELDIGNGATDTGSDELVYLPQQGSEGTVSFVAYNNGSDDTLKFNFISSV